MEPQRIEKLKPLIGRLIIYLSPILGVIVLFVVQKGSLKLLLSRCILLLLLSGAFFLVLKANDFFYLKRLKFPLYFFGCYFFSFFWVGINGEKHLGSLWLLLVVFAALDAGIELAVISDVFLMAAYALIVLRSGTEVKYFVAYFILGILFAVWFSIFRKKQEVLYLLLVLLTADMILQAYIYDFQFQKIRKYGTGILEEMICLLLLMAVGYVYVRFLSPDLMMKKVVVKKRIRLWGEIKEPIPTEEIEQGSEPIPQGLKLEKENEQMPANIEETKENEQALANIEETKENEQAPAALKETEETEQVQEKAKSTSLRGKDLFDEEEHLPRETEILRKILQPDFYLLKDLRQFSPRLYEHSQKISALAGGAARIAGGDELLARAGGMYHEIGRMDPENNYIAAGENLGTEAEFPDRLLAVMRQHSPTYEVPKSLEAVVVMLSDSIISTGEYLIKNGQRSQVSDEHLIENIFQNRISKGNLKEVSLSEEEISTLKEYFTGHVAVAEKSLSENL